MSTLIDIIERVAQRIELDGSVVRDLTGREPDTFEPNVLYVYPTPDAEQAIINDETGPARRQNFSVTATYVADDQGEEPHQIRLQAVTDVLSSKRDAYLARMAEVESCDLWDQIVARANMDEVRNFDGRAVAIRIDGYRFLT